MGKRNSVWTNQDGLFVGFGSREAEKLTGGNVGGVGAVQELVMEIKGAELGDTVSAADLANGGIIPFDAFIVSAHLFVTTAFVGVNAVLDIGLYDAASGAAVDDDGIDAAIATATLVDDFDVACDGADIGTVVATAAGVKVTASYDTAAFTAGVATLVVQYMPEA